MVGYSIKSIKLLTLAKYKYSQFQNTCKLLPYGSIYFVKRSDTTSLTEESGQGQLLHG